MEMLFFVAAPPNANCCDKCGREVTPGECALELALYVQSVDGLEYLFSQRRHLFPVEEDGEMICPGSPSRAQYLEGRPRDPRYPYDPEKEARYRDAFQRMTEAHAARRRE